MVTPRLRLLAVTEALARIDAAIESLKVADDRVRVARPAGEPALADIDAATDAARRARAKLEIALRRCPPFDSRMTKRRSCNAHLNTSGSRHRLTNRAHTAPTCAGSLTGMPGRMIAREAVRLGPAPRMKFNRCAHCARS